MIEDEAEKEFPAKETLYIRNLNEKIKAKGRTVVTQT